ncbi:hypothetical protein HMPREF1548_05577 [Clostridium sp. KLE 1755]|nr:hypothetical protein HMPREF1548_05577 [Clostridium sp. KLE 1755]
MSASSDFAECEKADNHSRVDYHIFKHSYTVCNTSIILPFRKRICNTSIYFWLTI